MHARYNPFGRNFKFYQDRKIRSRFKIIFKLERLYKRTKKTRCLLSKKKRTQKSSSNERKEEKYEFNSSST